MTTINIYFKQNSDAFSSPYYLFYSDSSYTTQVTSLEKGNTYRFNYDSNDAGHPFWVSSTNSHGSTDVVGLTLTASDNTASATSGITAGEYLDVEISSTYSGSDLYYYCTSHSSMIGSITVSAASAGSNGDPYIYPILSTTPVKLPNMDACYRLFERTNTFINASVKKATAEHVERMIRYAKKITPVTHNIVCNGYFYDKFFIASDNNTVLIDLIHKKIECSNKEYFNFKFHNKRYNKGEFDEHAKAITISWETIDGNSLSFSSLLFSNPHQENGLLFKTSYLNQSIGMALRNYKPKLMTIPNIKTQKYEKIHKKLKKLTKNGDFSSKNIYQKKSIKSKNEKWIYTKTLN